MNSNNDQILTGKMLKARGWAEGKVIGTAKAVGETLQQRGLSRDEVLDRLDEVRENPPAFLGDKLFGALAEETLRRTFVEQVRYDDKLRDEPIPFRTWGAEGIDQAAVDQMNNSARLPISAAGALMPDAHVGYGLPIGGVLATQGAVIPYAVGVDIACRMRISVYEVSPHVIGQKGDALAKAILDNTQFGAGAKWTGERRRQHDVLDDPAWKATRFLQSLHGKAVEQMGTSGSGNHFVEWGSFELEEDAPDMGLKAGSYLALLSHSGSRAIGHKIATEYSKIAMASHPTLPPSVKHLAWLPLDSADGQEYWTGMELAGRFASACHYTIHQSVTRAAGLKEIAHVENHHNFAWREELEDGTPVIVHRKGATPAGKGVLGMIPGSMGDPGYVVRGKGVAASINSAAHGAGRKMGRKQAINSLTRRERDKYLEERGVKLLGGGLDEAPQAYKNIDEVIAAQADLVEVVGKFSPRIVRMADEPGDI
jgi:tRNA-splicing ligase RtcB